MSGPPSAPRFSSGPIIRSPASATPGPSTSSTPPWRSKASIPTRTASTRRRSCSRSYDKNVLTLHFTLPLEKPVDTQDSDCEPQKPLSGDDGCGQELSTWFAMLKKAAIAGAGQPATGVPRKSSLTMSKLPQECGTVLTAGGLEPPIPVNAGLAQPVLKALASKETGPPPPKLDPATRRALIASSSGMPLPERNPRR
jgi:hypothetical protein